MKILVINTGSSSIKYKLFSMNDSTVLAHGILERIGEPEGSHTYQAKSIKEDIFLNDPIASHQDGMAQIVSLLMDNQTGVIKNKSEISAIGHRVVHGAESFQQTSIINDAVLSAIKENIPLAPLHNPANIIGIEVSKAIFPDAVQVAVFDTAFHQTIPPKAHLYALPYDLYESLRIRRYGFHGTSHQYVAQEAASLLEKPLESLNLISIHLGNGGSITAIEKGKSVDTSMGMTPLEGLIMGTRSGNIDPAIPFFLSANTDMSIQDIDTMLNKESGLKGICGLNDMRNILSAVEKGDTKAQTALDMYVYQIKKYIGSYFAILGQVNAIIFTAGIGEHSDVIRQLVCSGLESFGIQMSLDKNIEKNSNAREINTEDSPVRIFVIPTDEELKIARETLELIK